MKERPILFSGEMVRAILEGRKTVTRRVMVPQPYEVMLMGVKAHHWKNYTWAIEDRPGFVTPYGQPGDRLWVRETFVLEGNEQVDFDHKPPFNDGRPVKWDPWASGENRIWLQAHYAATDPTPELVNEDCEFERCANNGCCQHWKPSIHMPRWASRLTLEVTGVRVERVQDITEKDALAEGIVCGYVKKTGPVSIDGNTPQLNFFRLWDRLNAKRGFGWDKNPWVWVVEFKRVMP